MFCDYEQGGYAYKFDSFDQRALRDFYARELRSRGWRVVSYSYVRFDGTRIYYYNARRLANFKDI